MEREMSEERLPLADLLAVPLGFAGAVGIIVLIFWIFG